jgi:hypothetical protein
MPDTTYRQFSKHLKQSTPNARARSPARATSSRPLTNRTARESADRYVATESEAGRRPTLAGFEAYVKKAGLRGREILRDAYRDKMGSALRRGRPRKSPK